MTLFEMVFKGNDTVYKLTDGLIRDAIENGEKTRRLDSQIRRTACPVTMQLPG